MLDLNLLRRNKVTTAFTLEVLHDGTFTPLKLGVVPRQRSDLFKFMLTIHSFKTTHARKTKPKHTTHYKKLGTYLDCIVGIMVQPTACAGQNKEG